MIKPENFRFRALFGRTAFSSYKDGGDNEIRTRGLYVANVPLYQLSYIPISIKIIAYFLKNASIFMLIFKILPFSRFQYSFFSITLHFFVYRL